MTTKQKRAALSMLDQVAPVYTVLEKIVLGDEFTAKEFKLMRENIARDGAIHFLQGDIDEIMEIDNFT